MSFAPFKTSIHRLLATSLLLEQGWVSHLKARQDWQYFLGSTFRTTSFMSLIHLWIFLEWFVRWNGSDTRPSTRALCKQVLGNVCGEVNGRFNTGKLSLFLSRKGDHFCYTSLLSGTFQGLIRTTVFFQTRIHSRTSKF